MNNRIKKVRKSLNMTQEEFGAALGVGGSVVGFWERGYQALPDSRFRLICREFNVNKDWLRTGVGEMFNKPAVETDAEITTRHILDCYAKLPPELQEELLNLCRRLVEKVQKERSSMSDASKSVTRDYL